MSLLSDVKKVQEQVPAMEGSVTVADVKKKSSNSEYQKRQREHQFKAACTIRDFLKSKNIALPAEVQEEMDFLCKERKASAAGSAFGKPVFYKVFGDTPKIGDSVTALKVFEATGKGFQEMRQLMKKWAEKQGIIVKYDETAKSYKIESGDVKPYVAA